jgi:GMP synthase-like glutamine amidotransferase
MLYQYYSIEEVFPMRAHCFQHEPFEGLAALEPWFLSKGFKITYTKFFESEEIPSADDIDFLIIMGGGMSVNDEKDFLWLIKEKAFVREFINTGKPVIGICLGSQMIAAALGARVYRNSEKEIGWFPITKVKGVNSAIFADMPQELTVFHWHGETFDLPVGAIHIAESEVCKHQIFQYGKKTIAFQCHFETTPESLAGISSECASELIDAPFIQSAEKMKTLASKYCPAMQKVLFSLLDKLME